MKKYTLKWELVGAVFIVIIGGVLHFVFDFSGDWRPLATMLKESTDYGCNSQA